VRRPAIALTAAALSLALAASSVAAATPGTWSPVGPAVPTPFPTGVVGVYGTKVGPDGNLYVFGQFQNAGGDPTADNLAVYDSATRTWSGLGSNGDDGALNGTVTDVAWAGNSLWAVGGFTNAGGQANADYLAVWNGSSWTSRGGGGAAFTAAIASISIVNGLVYVAGSFANAGGNALADGLAVWDGSSWLSLDAPAASNGIFAGSTVWDIAVTPDGRVYAGGSFANVGPAGKCDRFCWWDPASEGWQALGTIDNAISNGSIADVALSGSTIYIGGSFVDASGNELADTVAVWGGTAWKNLGSNAAGTGGALAEGSIAQQIAVYGSNVIVAGLIVDAGDLPNADGVAAFNGTRWMALGDTPLGGYGLGVTVSGRTLYTGGLFTLTTPTGQADYLAQFALPAAPSAPRSLSGTSGSHKVSLAWAAPAATNGGAIRDYVVQYRKKGTTAWKTFADGVRTTRSAVVTGLTKGVTYQFRVRAKNDWGAGSYSTTISKRAG
jgi:trimeric autotransporter adhesin